MKIFVITTGKGTIYVVRGFTPSHAVWRFRDVAQGPEIASIVEAEGELP